MSLTRRTFLKLLSLASLLKYPRYGFPASIQSDHEAILRTLLDIMMPADDESPGAVDLNVDDMLLAKSEGDRRYRSLLIRGCDWLDAAAQEQYQKNFTDLSEQQCIRIIESMEQSAPGTWPHAFFKRIQYDLFELYYSQSASWQGLLIDHPPQPRGYTDYSQPPMGLDS